MNVSDVRHHGESIDAPPPTSPQRIDMEELLSTPFNPPPSTPVLNKRKSPDPEIPRMCAGPSGQVQTAGINLHNVSQVVNVSDSSHDGDSINAPPTPPLFDLGESPSTPLNPPPSTPVKRKSPDPR